MPHDYAQALVWYRKAAELGNAVAQVHLGVMYAVGRGVSQDDDQAVAWWRKAADQGDALGQDVLGWVYAQGRGVPQDDAQALIWFPQAAGQGDADAQGVLGKMYRDGRGVPKDYLRAHMWLNLAASLSDDATRQVAVKVRNDMLQMAVKAHDEVAAKMTPAQIVERSGWRANGCEHMNLRPPRFLSVGWVRVRYPWSATPERSRSQ